MQLKIPRLSPPASPPTDRDTSTLKELTVATTLTTVRGRHCLYFYMFVYFSKYEQTVIKELQFSYS